LIEPILASAGYQNLRSTTDARQAVPFFLEFEPDLVTVYLMMPQVDGYTLLRQFASLIPSGSYLPILVLTADVSREAKRKALDLGANDFSLTF
jgi:PleD family two-component response regulator